MRKSKLLFFILAVSGLFVVALWFVSVLEVSNANVNVWAVPVDLAPAKVTLTSDHLKASRSVYQGINIVTLIKDDPDYQFAIHYPEFDDKQLNQAVNEYVSMAKEDFFVELEENKEILHGHAGTFYLMFDIYSIVDGVYSIVFTNESYVGGANGQQSSKVFIVDLNENRFIPQTEIINDYDVNRDKFLQLLTEQFERSENYREYIFVDELEKWISDEKLPFEKVYLTDQELVFKFDKYQVTAGVAGSPEIAFSYDQVVDLLTDGWIEKLNTKIEVEDDIKQGDATETEEPSKGIVDGETKKKVALTFDDGPDPVHTLEILSLLDQYQARATFFVLGNRVDFYPSIIQEMADKGHEIGNHTWNHKDLTKLSSDQIKNEINKTSNAIKAVIGEGPQLYRPPYGAINDQVRGATNLKPVLWTVDPQDWLHRDATKVFNHVKANVTDGSIVLMHDIYGSTVEAVGKILSYLAAEGYQFVTVSELDS